jgi:hypothetical protein
LRIFIQAVLRAGGHHFSPSARSADQIIRWSAWWIETSSALQKRRLDESGFHAQLTRRLDVRLVSDSPDTGLRFVDRLVTFDSAAWFM